MSLLLALQQSDEQHGDEDIENGGDGQPRCERPLSTKRRPNE